MNSKHRRAVNTALVLTVFLYALWGMAHSLNDILVAQFKRAFYLSDFQASLVQSSFYIAYLVMPIPVALFLQRFGYKTGIITGLSIFAVGALLFWPAAAMLSYGAFLAALFVIACGMTFLETAGTGVVVVLGPAERTDWRINLAQAFNPIGAIVGVVIGRQFILSHESAAPDSSAVNAPALQIAEAQAVQTPYLVIGLCVLAVAILVAITAFPKTATQVQRSAPFAGLAALMRSRLFVAGVLTQFFYVGTQIGVMSFIIRYAQHARPDLSDRDAAFYLTVSLCLFLAGRMLVLLLLRWWSSAQIAVVFSAAASLLTGIAVCMPTEIGLIALVTGCFFMSVLFPAIYSIGLHGNAQYSQTASALMIMAIAGGAVLTAAMGAVSDRSTIAHAYALPLAGFVIVFCFCSYALRLKLASGSNFLEH